jgi:predicted transcriptional regulator
MPGFGEAAPLTDGRSEAGPEADESGLVLPGFGPLESAIMTVLWEAGKPLNCRGIAERLAYRTGHGAQPAYTTIMTVTTILYRKGILHRSKPTAAADRRAWWYTPRQTLEDHLAAIVRNALSYTPNPVGVLRRALPAHGPYTWT